MRHVRVQEERSYQSISATRTASASEPSASTPISAPHTFVCHTRTLSADVRSPFDNKSLTTQILCDAYLDESLTDDGGAPFVRYVRLLEKVEGVFGVRGLEKKPQCDVDASIKAAKVSHLQYTYTCKIVSRKGEGGMKNTVNIP